MEYVSDIPRGLAFGSAWLSSCQTSSLPASPYVGPPRLVTSSTATPPCSRLGQLAKPARCWRSSNAHRRSKSPGGVWWRNCHLGFVWPIGRPRVAEIELAVIRLSPHPRKRTDSRRVAGMVPHGTKLHQSTSERAQTWWATRCHDTGRGRWDEGFPSLSGALLAH